MLLPRGAPTSQGRVQQGSRSSLNDMSHVCKRHNDVDWESKYSCQTSGNTGNASIEIARRGSVSKDCRT